MEKDAASDNGRASFRMQFSQAKAASHLAEKGRLRIVVGSATGAYPAIICKAVSMPKQKSDEDQSRRFIEKARELGCDEDPKAFEQ